jgi:hypothetical protein
MQKNMANFIADIVKALPDAIATAIVTVLLTGGVPFLFQQKIANYFTKSLFVYQTKFSINHAKAVETLETLYKKFVAYHKAVTDTISEKNYPGNDAEKTKKMKADSDKLLREFEKYSKDNRLYLPNAIAESILRLNHDVSWLAVLLMLGLMSDVKTDKGELKWEGTPPTETTGYKENPDDHSFDPPLREKKVTTYETPFSLFQHIKDRLDKQEEFLERLYQSVADIKSL